MRLYILIALFVITADPCSADDVWSWTVSDIAGDAAAAYDITRASASHDGNLLSVTIQLAGQYSAAPYTVYAARIRTATAIYGLAFVTASSYWGPKLGVSYDNGASWNYAPGNPTGSVTPTQVNLQIPMASIGPRPWQIDFISGVWWYFNSYELRDTTAAATVPPYMTPYSVTSRQRTDGSKKVDVYYDLWSSLSETAAVSMAVSSDGGTTYSITPSSLSGNVGPGVRTGTRRHIVWDAGTDLPGAVGSNYRVRLTTSY